MRGKAREPGEGIDRCSRAPRDFAAGIGDVPVSGLIRPVRSSPASFDGELMKQVND